MSRSILHMVSPLKHMSPFDVNMAVDAGFDAVVPYTNVTLEEVRGLVQDAMFSRGPGDGARTGVFIAGKKADLALDMLQAAKEAFVPPFAVNVFADPAGSFTTGAALVAVVGKALRDKHATTIKGKRVVVFGGTGVVAYCAAVLAAGEAARVVLVGHDGAERVRAIAAGMKRRFDVAVEAVDGSTAQARGAALHDAEVVLSAGPAGRTIVSAAQLTADTALLVVADVNAVPPPGIEGVAATDNDKPLGRAVAIGALTIGNIKYKTESRLFRRMLATQKPLSLDFRDAHALALEIAG
jgi:methylene-tetrahydromethanopterin dehydrogenase